MKPPSADGAPLFLMSELTRAKQGGGSCCAEELFITRLVARKDFSGSVVSFQMLGQAGVGDEALDAQVARKRTLAVVTQDVRQ